jgi:hypothetical protein
LECPTKKKARLNAGKLHRKRDSRREREKKERRNITINFPFLND